MEGKNAVFQKLKPPCVALSQAALMIQGSKGNAQTVTERLETLKHALSSVTSRSNALDSKIAEYVFFPVSQVLKASQRISIRALELCLQCIAILIEHGWRQDVAPQLAAQVVILCSMLGERNPKGLQFSTSTDELQQSAFICLYHLFSTIESRQETKQALISEANFPQLGQTISTILDGIHDNPSVEVQIAATSALDALLLGVIDREIQANFLPGIVSKLTRVLTPLTKQRRNHRVLIGCLKILETLIENTMGDKLLSTTTKGAAGTINKMPHHQAQSAFDTQWLEQAAKQLKPAISTILRLKTHTRDDVKQALSGFCLMLLIRGRQSLANCSMMALETLITLCTVDDSIPTKLELEMLVNADRSIVDLLQSLLYDWLQSLTTVVQGPDEQAKTSKLYQIGVAYDLLRRTGVYTNMIDRVVSRSLRDSVVITLTVAGTTQQTEPLSTQIQAIKLADLKHESVVMDLSSSLIKYKGQETTIRSIENVAKLVSSSNASASFLVDLAREIHQSQGETQIANFWLMLTAIQSSGRSHDGVDNLLNIEDGSVPRLYEYLEDLYSFSLSVLTENTGEPPDERLQALALRGLALRAQHAGQDFRYELVDALYPVLHTLATPVEHLQSHSISTLNTFVSTCGYHSVQDLIVQNVDYLTNAVALKLNAFDVSPQAPQVLLMMIRLAGPSLLPYLEDTIESIFAALEDYHGYPLLVELLFKVLGVAAEEGVKTPQLAIANGNAVDSNLVRFEPWHSTGISELKLLLQDRPQANGTRNETVDNDKESHPKRPWKDFEDMENGTDEVQEESDQNQKMEEAEQPPPAPKTYSLLFKITELTQHFLSSASPSLRTSLLSLIRTTVPAIAKHENSFLPLVNTLWPEVVSRLDDDEPYIQAAALDIVRALCDSAGDFMRSRVVQLWPRLVEIHHSATSEIVRSTAHRSSESASSTQSHRGSAINSALVKSALAKLKDGMTSSSATSSRLVWESLAACLKSIVRSVQVPPELFDEALEMMEPVLENEQVQLAFEMENADALWLALIRTGAISKPQKPSMGGYRRWCFAEITG